MLAGMLSAVLAVTALPLAPLTAPQKEVKAASVTLQNPRIVKDDSMEEGQKVTWDCIWFGSYPQREVVTDVAGYDAIYKDYYNPKTDIIEDAALFQKLETADGWSDNEITLDGNKYRRMKKGDATYSYSGTANRAYYRWKDSTSWHYFRYEPIKWRVLSIAGDQAFLLSDLALDDQRYNYNDISITWETSSMRSWLNGYGSETNEPQMDYRNDSFLQDAFTSAQQQAIRTTEVENADNLYYETEGGNNTKDKIFLLSEQEVYGAKAGSYGFSESYDTYDEAKRRKSSTYAKAKGVRSDYGDGAGYDGNCYWWLRTPGGNTDDTMRVAFNGCVDRSGGNVLNYDVCGVCPALNLNLSSSDLWSYAGTVCSDGTVNGQEASWTPQEKESEKQPESQKQTESQKQPEKEENLPKAGDVIQTNDAVYRITKMAATGNTVTLEKPLKKTNRTFNVPAAIKSADGKAVFRVTGIAKNAFRKNTKLTKVLLGGNLAKIGANAFSGCKNLKTIRIASTSLTKKSVGKNTFKGIHKKAVIKVPKKKLKAYQKFLKGKGQAKSVKIKK